MSARAKINGRAAAIGGLSDIADRFDGLIVDQYGVLHDGLQRYPDAVECLEAHGRTGKRVVVLSNSGRRVAHNRERLARLGFAPQLFTAIVTSGEALWQALAHRDDAFHAMLGRRCYVIAESDEAQFLHGLGLEPRASIADVDFVLLLGIDTPRRSIDDYMSLLGVAIARGLPLLCANSDIVRFTRHGLQPAPGALARRYESAGGEVRWYGKPQPAIYERCLAAMNGIDRDRVLGIGDSIEHDIAGAAAAGLGSVYIRGGIGHATDAIERSLEVLPDYVTERFRW